MVENYERSTFQFRSNVITATLTGPKLSMTSTQYDMAAPRIVITTRKGGKPERWNVSTANATGGTRIVVRGPEPQQITTVTCDSALFTASQAGPAVGRIDLKGSVRSVTRGPAFPEPMVNVAESGVINILGPNQIDVDLFNGTLQGTFREPAPRPKRN